MRYSRLSENNVKIEFTILKTGFLTTFYRNTPLSTSDRTSQREVDDIKKWDKKWGKKWGKNEKKIISIIYENNQSSIVYIAGKTGLSTSGVEKIIKRLKERGIIKRIGPANGGYWEVIIE